MCELLKHLIRTTVLCCPNLPAGGEMVVRLLPRQPEYGSGFSFDTEDEPDVLAPVDLTVERPIWAPVTPEAGPPTPVQIIDGVRRAEAFSLDDDPDGLPIFGLFGSYAVGTVRCDGVARMPEEHIRVERRYLYAGEGSVSDEVMATGMGDLVFSAFPVPDLKTATSLLGALNAQMLGSEAALVEELSHDESLITVVDGPIRQLRAPGRRVVGYVKSVHQWDIGPVERDMLRTLVVGERTPIYLKSTAEDRSGGGRYSWFLRLRRLTETYHPLGSIVRIDAPARLPLADVVKLADQATRTFPRLSSQTGRDPRAPHNLVPVGALETHLTHRMGDRTKLRRLIAANIGRRAIEEMYA